MQDDNPYPISLAELFAAIHRSQPQPNEQERPNLTIPDPPRWRLTRPKTLTEVLAERGFDFPEVKLDMPPAQSPARLSPTQVDIPQSFGPAEWEPSPSLAELLDRHLGPYSRWVIS